MIEKSQIHQNKKQKLGFFNNYLDINRSKEVFTSGLNSIDSTTYDALQAKIQPKKGFFLIKWLTDTSPKPIIPCDQIYPYLNANVFSILTFSWVAPIIKKGYLRRLEEEDLYKLGDDLKTEEMTRIFEKNLKIRSNKWNKKHPNQPYPKWIIIGALNDTFKHRFWIESGLAKVISDLLQVTMPLLVRALVKYIQKKNSSDFHEKLSHAIGYSIGISLMLICNSIGISRFFHGSMMTGAQVKAVLTNVIYKKTFRISPKASFEFPNGKVNSLVMADLSRVDIAVGVFHFIWSFPISFSVGIIILCINLSAPALIGISCILLLLSSIFYVNKKLKQLRKKSTEFIDKRVSSINEVINNFKMIKFYSWEQPYLKMIEEYRTNEKGYILRIQLWRSWLNSGISSITYVATLFTFLTMFYTNNNFQSYNIFSAITLFNVLRMPLNLLPFATSLTVDALLAMERVTNFLQAEEGKDTVERFDLKASENSIEINNASFHWSIEESKIKKKLKKIVTNKKIDTIITNKSIVINEIDDQNLGFPGFLNINLNIKRSEFIIITGSIGTGKSSLLNAIEGSMRKESGNLNIYGSLTFCSYPWVQNTTIKENILFGLPFNRLKYQSIIHACALDVDFEILPGGDQTEVGERGITLSGGQKARINLARAVYADRDIILLDDVLSAVDARVGRHIMNECICGILKNKTRLLATHQLSLVGSADRIIFLDGSGSIDVGTQDELLTKSEAFFNLMQYSKETKSEDNDEEDELEKKEQIILKKQNTQISQISDIESESNEKHNKKVNDFSELRNTKSISMSIYANYLKLGSGMPKWLIVPLFFLGLAFNGFLQLFHSVWLTFWLSDRFGYKSDVYAGLYGLFVALAVLSYICLYTAMASINNNAGLKLFNLSARKLLSTPMWFMDVTPLGRILNRFTKDVDVLDTELIEQLRLLLTSTSLVGATIILCGIYIPWFFVAVPFVLFFYWCLAKYYKSSALDIKRMEANSRSFVFSHFNESLSGIKVIKSYGSTERFMKTYEKLIDNMNAAYFLTMANQRWLSIRLDFISCLVTLFVSIMCVCGVFNLNSSSSGLLVSYMIQMSTMISLMIRSMTQVENDFNSAERLFEYVTELPAEGPFEKEEMKPSKSWPENGAIDFNDVSLSYREGLPLVLKNVSFNVKASAKIGICGRTGAGKSTIMNALFRVNELAGGSVVIDGVNIADIGLNDLRSKLSIIPQDPVLFHGTIRQNLDPFGNSSDADLWDALRRSNLVETDAVGTGKFIAGQDDIKKFHKFHLDQLVENDSANFSLGERQLIALARALVRNSKILILDEATSSVDYETDAMIQQTIMNEFNKCTILCIAHRLKTILNYDSILVLDNGKVEEFDTPYNLFLKNGIFTEMCERSKIKKEDFFSLC